MTNSIRVLIADDSPTVRYHLASMINETAGLRVIGEARDGHEAILMAETLKPDVISMDINMPRMDGLEATRLIMAQFPTPVVIVSGLVETDVELAFQAIQAGALAVVEKPPDRQNPTFPDKHRQLVKTLVAMAGVRVIHRRAPTQPLSGGKVAHRLDVPIRRSQTALEIVAIGASAGGPGALSKLLRELPANLPVPVVIVQHMPNEFIPGLARWLNKVSPLDVRVANDNALLEPGVVHLSPGTCHLSVVSRGKALVTHLIHEQGPHRYQPSVNVLFNSVATACGEYALGLLLTGMGDDGADGLLTMRHAGAHTYAQDEQSSIVFGMPSAAIERGAVEEVLPLASIPAAILKLL